MYDDMLSLLDNADPQTLQLMLQALNANESMGMGQGLMGTPAPEGRNVGHTYVAASPLEHAASTLQRIGGLGMINKGQGQRASGIQAFINALRQPRPPDPSLNAFDNPENYG